MYSKTYRTFPETNPFGPNRIYEDRFIGQNVRLLSDLMEYTDVKNISAIFLFIDFEKAFDSIEWNFIKRSLAPP